MTAFNSGTITNLTEAESEENTAALSPFPSSQMWRGRKSGESSTTVSAGDTLRGRCRLL